MCDHTAGNTFYHYGGQCCTPGVRVWLLQLNQDNYNMQLHIEVYILYYVYTQEVKYWMHACHIIGLWV